MAAISHTDAQRTESGLAAGLTAYLLWGFLPLLFDLMKNVPSTTLVADRTLWSLLVVGVLLIVGGRMAEVQAILRDRRAVRSMALAAFVLGGNWLIFVYAVETDQVLEVSFGYFINPIVNIAIGMLVLGERLNRWQGVAVAIAVVAIGIQALGLGGVPYVALGLALTFALYGYLRKTAKASSAVGLFAETLILSPVALAYLLITFVLEGGIGVHGEPQTLLLLMLMGPATALPLLLFAYAVQRLRFTTIGMLQYIAPSISFVLAIVVFGEHLNGVRLLSFGLIWLSLVVYTTDSVVRRRGREA